jgi:hypothetical protein
VFGKSLLSVTIFGNVNFIVLGKGKPEERDNMKDLGVDGTILKRILLRWDGTDWPEFLWHRTGACVRFLLL